MADHSTLPLNAREYAVKSCVKLILKYGGHVATKLDFYRVFVGNIAKNKDATQCLYVFDRVIDELPKYVYSSPRFEDYSGSLR
jgi:hypothetical protein